MQSSAVKVAFGIAAAGVVGVGLLCALTKVRLRDLWWLDPVSFSYAPNDGGRESTRGSDMVLATEEHEEEGHAVEHADQQETEGNK